MEENALCGISCVYDDKCLSFVRVYSAFFQKGQNIIEAF